MIKVKERNSGRICEAINCRNMHKRMYEKICRVEKFEDIPEPTMSSVKREMKQTDYKKGVIIINGWAHHLPSISFVPMKEFNNNWETL